SETDTEVLAHLIEEVLAKGGAFVEAVAGALNQVEGTYGIAVVSTREPDTIVAARKGSPLLVAIGSGENFVASDASAVLAHTRSVVYLDEGEIAVVRPGDYRILALDAVEKEKAVTQVDWDLATIERGGYAHCMLRQRMDEKTLVVGISQSGETADTLAALREAKRRGARTLGLVNVVGSTIAREVDGGIYLHAGPEIGVASTKAFTSQIAALALLTLAMGRLRALSILQGREVVRALRRLPDLVAQVLAKAPEVERIGERVMRANNVLYLGRGYNFPVALEGALKLKE